jgi:hypothetical protein
VSRTTATARAIGSTVPVGVDRIAEATARNAAA